MKEQFNLCLSTQFCKYIASNFLCNLCTRQYPVSFCLIPASEQTTSAELSQVVKHTYSSGTLNVSLPFKITTVYFSYRLEVRKRYLSNRELEASIVHGGF